MLVFSMPAAVLSPRSQSEYQLFLHRLDHLFLVDAESLHEPAELLWRQFLQLICCPRPLILSAFKPLVEEDVSVGIPIQGLDPVRSPSAENKQSICLWVHVKGVLDDGSKSVDTASEITISYRNIDFLRLGQIKHRGSPPEGQY